MFRKQRLTALFWSLLAAGACIVLPSQTCFAQIKLLRDNLPNSITQGRLAFDYSSADGKRRLYVLDFATQTIEPVPGSVDTDGNPSWSPNGTALAFHSRKDGNFEVFTIRSDGTKRTQLTTSPTDDAFPDWSPSENKIVYRSQGSATDFRIISIHPDGSMPSTVYSSVKAVSVPKWSPGGTEILVCSGAIDPGEDIALLKIGGDLKPLSKTRLDYCKINLEGKKIDSAPSWSPDGLAIAFAAGPSSGSDLYIVRKSPGKSQSAPERLTNFKGFELEPIWVEAIDPVGTKLKEYLFFVSDTGKKTGQHQIYVYEFDTKQTIRLTENDGKIKHLSFTPFPALPKRPQEVLNKEAEGEQMASEVTSATDTPPAQ